MTLRGAVVQEGREKGHVCGPGWVWREKRPFDPKTMALPDPPTGYYWRDPWDVALDTVVQCDCGATWRCDWDKGYATEYIVVVPRKKWRLESKRERKRRERKARDGCN